MGDVVANEIQFPESPSDLVQHRPVDVALFLVGAQGEARPVLASRTSTTHLRPNGAIVQVRPQFQKRPWPVKRDDSVRVRLSRGATGEPLVVDGHIAWVRDRAFMPSGLAVTLVGVTFEWDAEVMALEVAAFLARGE